MLTQSSTDRGFTLPTLAHFLHRPKSALLVLGGGANRTLEFIELPKSNVLAPIALIDHF
jgi:hypothetical protein